MRVSLESLVYIACIPFLRISLESRARCAATNAYALNRSLPFRDNLTSFEKSNFALFTHPDLYHDEKMVLQFVQKVYVTRRFYPRNTLSGQLV